MTARLRAFVLVAVVALGAAGLTVGVTLATRTTPPSPTRSASSPGTGPPPLMLDLGVRTGAEAAALRRATGLYDRGELDEAAAVFRRYGSLEAEVGTALSAWPDGFDRLARLAREHPRSGLVQLNYGLALYWRGEKEKARGAWQRARAAHPDTPYAVRAQDLLHPNFPRGLPTFVPSFSAPAALSKLSPPHQLAYLERRARAGIRDKLLYGVALQRLGHPLSALREYEAAAAAAPADLEPKVAVAVGRFDKANPSRALSVLGRLSRRHPDSQSVRFHLGLLLLWVGSVDEAKRQLRLARAAGQATPLGREASRFLNRLQGVGAG